MPATSVSMRGTNWLSADCGDFTDREILFDRPSAPRLPFVRVLCGIVPAAFDFDLSVLLGSVYSATIKPSTRSARSISVTSVLKLWRHRGRREPPLVAALPLCTIRGNLRIKFWEEPPSPRPLSPPRTPAPQCRRAGTPRAP